MIVASLFAAENDSGSARLPVFVLSLRHLSADVGTTAGNKPGFFEASQLVCLVLRHAQIPILEIQIAEPVVRAVLSLDGLFD